LHSKTNDLDTAFGVLPLSHVRGLAGGRLCMVVSRQVADALRFERGQ